MVGHLPRRNPAGTDQRGHSVSNYDLRIAATHVLEANANLGITRANQLPSLNGSVGIADTQNQIYPNSTAFETAERRSVALLCRRFLGAIPPGDRGCARHPPGYSVWTAGRSNYADLFGR